MDKLKQRAKKKRRNLKRCAAAEEKRRLAEEFNEHYKNCGLRHDFRPDDIWRAYKDIERDCICGAVVAATIITLWVMRDEFGFGSLRLFRLASEITVRVGWVGRDERSMAQLEEELRLDGRLDCAKYWDGYNPNIEKGLRAGEYQRRGAVLKSMPYTWVIHMHAVFYTLFKNPITRRSIRLERVARRVSNTAKYAIENGRLEYYRADLERCGFHIDMEGKYGCRNVEQCEYEKYMKRIKSLLA